MTLILKYVKTKENVCDYCSQHPYKDLKFKELMHYINFVADDATSNALTTDINKFSKNDKL